MASDLTVQTIRGPGSGANANKVIVPAGQTLTLEDKLAYSNMPVGSIVQVKSLTYPYFDSTSTSYVDVVTTTFTPKLSNSRILVEATGHFYKYNSVSGGNSPWRLTYNGTEIFQNQYMFYMYSSSLEYMYSGSVRGLIDPGNTNTVTVNFQANAGTQGRSYIYGNTGVFTITEIRQ